MIWKGGEENYFQIVKCRNLKLDGQVIVRTTYLDVDSIHLTLPRFVQIYFLSLDVYGCGYESKSRDSRFGCRASINSTKRS